MAINRIAYFAQAVEISYTDESKVFQTVTLPVNTANIEVSRPIDAITSFGQFNALNQAQTNITTCKSSVKGYLGFGGGINGLTNEILSGLIYATQNGTGAGGITISVAPEGFSMTGILTNIGLDIAVGGFGMFDLGFAGVGNPAVSSASSSQTTPTSDSYSIQPITTMSVANSGLLSGASATSIKFSYDLPTDTLSALGENPNATQGLLNSIIATKAPYKTSLSVEGFGVNPNISDADLLGGVSIGNIGIVMPKAKVTSRSFNNAAGQASATFAYSAEDVSAEFINVNLQDYVQNNDRLVGPSGMWGENL